MYLPELCVLISVRFMNERIETTLYFKGVLTCKICNSCLSSDSYNKRRYLKGVRLQKQGGSRFLMQRLILRGVFKYETMKIIQRLRW